jgi:hypothetical protein
MATEAQVVANRRNAEKSTGPRTAEGKAAVSQNAVKHGLLAQADVIRGEDREEFELYREELFWELNPVGTMESRLAERIVSLAWRLRRAERIHNEAFDALLAKASPLARLTQSLRSKGADQPPDDSDGCDGDSGLGRTVVRDFSGARVLDRLLMYERRIESSLYRTMAELQKLRRTRELEADGGANVSKASRLRTAGGTPATQPPARPGLTSDCAKQSQLPPVAGVHGPPCESGEASPGEGTPDGVATSVGDSVKQSQFPPADGGVCSVPARASVRVAGILPAIRGRDALDTEAPDSVTTSGETSACETKPICGAQSATPYRATTSERGAFWA